MSNIQIGWKVDTNACLSCRACEMACKVEFDLKAGQGRRRRVIEKTMIEAATDSADTGTDVVRTFFLSLACNQCENPACIAACPKSDAVDVGTDTGSALWKDTTAKGLVHGVEGVVHHNDSECIGCRRCEWACPYGAPQYNAETGRIHKCEMCWQRIKSTTLHPSRRVGACVATCLGQAIKQDWVETSAGQTYSTVLNTRKDTDNYTEGINVDPTGTGLLGGSVTSGTQGYLEGEFVEPGSAGKGSAYVADAAMTRPALKIRNRVYVTRDGSGVE